MSVGVDNICSNEEMLMKDLVSKYFLEIKAVIIATKPSSMMNHLRVYFLSMSSFTHESAETEEYFGQIHN